MTSLVSYVVDEQCTACGACLLTCPEHAFVPGLPLVVRADRCSDCGECVEVCPRDAITRVPAPHLPAPFPGDHGDTYRSPRVRSGTEVHDRREKGAVA